MSKKYLKYIPLFTVELFFIILAVSCKKDHSNPAPAGLTNFAKLGLYEEIGSTDRRIFMAVTKVGTQTTNYGLVFDTGSTGLTIDANGVLPSSMVTSNGIQVAGDSVTTATGITVTTQQAILSFGGVDGEIQEYGNLGYATITLGDASGNVTTPRIPIFLYYKVMNITTQQQLPAHSADVFGVGPGVSAASVSIASPLSYFKLPAGLTNGFRLATLNSAGFNTSATYVAGLLYIGLTNNDLAGSNFVMHPLSYSPIGGYSPNIPSTITYNGQSIASTILFDTGTPATTIIENSSANSNVAALPVNTQVSITTGQGFSYQYTITSNYNLTQVENTSYSHDIRTIFSIDFFLNNEYLLDYTNHQIGLKNN